MRLLDHLFSRVANRPFYVRISRNRLSVRNVHGGGYFDDEPLVAVSEEDPPSIVAIGANARIASSRCINPFSDPRVLVSNFAVAERLLQYAFLSVSEKGVIRLAPIAVIHPIEKLEGGLTEIARCTLRELAEKAGAASTYFWEGRQLTDMELLSGVYKTAT